MQKDNAHLDLDDFGASSGVLTPAEDYSDAVEAQTYTLMDDDVGDADQEAETKPATPADDAPPPKPADDDEDDEDDEYASRSDIEARLAGMASTSASTPQPGTETPDTESAEAQNVEAQGLKMGAAAKKRAKKAAKQAEAEQSASASGNKCAGCDADFPSKSKLHDHLKKFPKHAALKTVPSGAKKGKRK
jgi:DnaJ family protein A protein 5